MKGNANRSLGESGLKFEDLVHEPADRIGDVNERVDERMGHFVMQDQFGLARDDVCLRQVATEHRHRVVVVDKVVFFAVDEESRRPYIAYLSLVVIAALYDHVSETADHAPVVFQQLLDQSTLP